MKFKKYYIDRILFIINYNIIGIYFSLFNYS